MTQPTRDPALPPEHVTSEDLAAYLDGHLPPTRRESVAAHLAACAECRAEVVELRSVLGAHGERPRMSRAVIALAAAAALVFAIVPLSQRGANATRTDGVTRASDVRPFETPPIPVLEPIDGDTIDAPAPRLIWRSAGSDAMYLVTLQDTAGKVIWSTTATDTSVNVPSTAKLQRAQRYFWSVDARLADGHTAQTGVRSFTVR